MSFQLLINAAAIGSIYAAVALSFCLIWNAANIVNFAQGEVVMLGAFAGLSLYVFLGLPYAVVFAISVVGVGIFGVMTERFIIRPVRRADPLATIIVTIGLSIALANLARISWGSHPFRFPSVFGDKPKAILSFYVIPESLWIIGIVLWLMLLQQVFFKWTTLGKAMRGVAQDREAALMMGIDVNLMVGLTFGLGCALAAAAGLLLAPIYFVSHDMGLGITLRAFIATIIGGFGSPLGAVVGGVLLGIIETVSTVWVPEFREGLIFLILLIVLWVRPQGLFKVRL